MGGNVASQGGISSMIIHESRRMGGVPPTPLPASSLHSVVFSPVPLPPSTSSVISIQEAIPAQAPPVPVTSIKDKPSNMGLKDITDKVSWIEAKAAINSRLRRAPFWPSPTSKALITTPDYMVASVWWEELLYYYLLWKNLNSMERVLKCSTTSTKLQPVWCRQFACVYL
jgi:hypothetical protein